MCTTPLLSIYLKSYYDSGGLSLMAFNDTNRLVCTGPNPSWLPRAQRRPISCPIRGESAKQLYGTSHLRLFRPAGGLWVLPNCSPYSCSRLWLLCHFDIYYFQRPYRRFCICP
ncbi:hypothetical protein AVEN_143038-1 [Araneus ventricosus]|uniref:Uncharacterized protein n=1 Tax=Araneus ventricosus TaxID=182803 RepID=A0A4Y2KT57_ARAVE|nr:hypothetical protein AVEN_143038-1 [Araneus ventricosus]